MRDPDRINAIKRRLAANNEGTSMSGSRRPTPGGVSAPSQSSVGLPQRNTGRRIPGMSTPVPPPTKSSTTPPSRVARGLSPQKPVGLGKQPRKSKSLQTPEVGYDDRIKRAVKRRIFG